MLMKDFYFLTFLFMKITWWSMEIIDQARTFNWEQFSFSELLGLTEWAEEHSNVANVVPIMLGTLQKLRKEWLVEFVSRWVYRLTEGAKEVQFASNSEVRKEKIKVEAPILTKAQSKVMHSIANWMYLENIHATNSYFIADSTSRDRVNDLLSKALISKGLVSMSETDTNHTIYR